MRRFALTIATLVAVPALAEKAWQPLNGDQINAALSDHTYVYENHATQRFYASGRTLYNAGQDSWGYWEVRGDLYCSQWPPAGGWACYDVERLATRLRFIGERGDVTVGVRK